MRPFSARPPFSTLSLVLTAALLSVTACPGPRSLSVSSSGGACTNENEGACESPTRLLICHNKVWVVASDCKGPDGCRLNQDTYDCDLRGNSIGDTCPAQSEGKVRCDPDGGVNILRCVDSVLRLEYACPTATVCDFIEDAGLSCR